MTDFSMRAAAAILGSAVLAMFIAPPIARSADVQPIAPPASSQTQANAPLPGETSNAPTPDPMSGFNEAMFNFNLKLDDWILHPVASGYATIAPEPVRASVGNFFDNVNVIPRFANNLFQAKFAEAGVEVARFGINSTLGVAGFFDPAKKWFGLDEHKNDFGQTIRYYSAPTGPYLMLPFLGPSTVGDAIGVAADGAMNPMNYLVPWWVSLSANGGERVVEAVNYRSQHLDQFEQADRYAIDLYGAVQDAYLQQRANETKKLHEEEW